MMLKRVIPFVLLGLGVAALAGCPIYGDDRDRRVCDASGCYTCIDYNRTTQRCFDWTCNSNEDCPNDYTCNPDHRCMLSSTPVPSNVCSKPSECPAGSNCGADSRCHAGDCSTTGCPSAYVCKLSGGVPACVPRGSSSGDGGITSTCKSDTDCPTPAGSKCLSGSCVAPADQCADATQCASGSQCVDGACTPSCGTTSCPVGHGCDATKGVCTQNPTPCGSSSECTGGTVCVDQHCVTSCATTACAAGLLCIDGGCVPDEKPVFVCATDGVKDACQQGSICLRHSCYIGCDADAGADACKSADNFNVCKEVTTSSGAHSVCGSSTNLGTDCDPTLGKNCASPLICIDGYCR